MGSQNILKKYDEVKKQYDAINYDNILAKEVEKNTANEQADIDTLSSGYDKQIANTRATYDKQIGDTKIAYEDAHQRNAVQKLINEKQIAERNVNLGLTDSGLNRTQQTAAQLSYANQKGEIDLSRQIALDTLNLKLTDAITKLENSKASGIRDIKNNWKSYSETQAQNIYESQLNSYASQLKDLSDQYVEAVKSENDAAAQVQNAAIVASDKDEFVRFVYSGKNRDTGKYIFYRDGKKYEFDKGVNPYTGTTSVNVKYGTFNNGYQPNNLGYINKDGEKVLNKLKPSGIRDYVNGNEQTVWEDINGKKWIWDGTINNYKVYVE